MTRHRFRALSHRLAALHRPKARTLFVVIRLRDGYGWQGPWRYQGRTFTKNPAYWYRYGSRTAAETALSWEAWEGVEVREISVPAP